MIFTPRQNSFQVITSQRTGWTGNVASMGESRVVYRGLEGNPEGTRPLGKPRSIWDDNIKRDIQEVGCEGMDWIELAQNKDR